MHTFVSLTKQAAEFKAGSRRSPRELRVPTGWQGNRVIGVDRRKNALEQLSKPVKGDSSGLAVTAFNNDTYGLRCDVERGVIKGSLKHLTIKVLEITPQADNKFVDIPLGNANSSADTFSYSHGRLQPRFMSMNQFDTIKLLGHGSSSKLYLVKDKLSEKLYALKVVRKRGLTDKALGSVLAEQQAMIMMAGTPYIVQLLASWHDTKNFYMLMPYYPAGDLASQLKLTELWDPVRVRFIVAMLSRALYAIHAKGITHRGIELSSVLMAEDGCIALGGFRSCLLPDIDGKPRQSKDIAGSSLFWSPEQWRGLWHGQGVDVFGFGIIMYRLSTGRFPRFSDNPMKMMRQVCYHPLRWEKGDCVEPAAKLLIFSCAEPDVKDRVTMDKVLDHPYFTGFEWSQMTVPSYMAPICPPLTILTPARSTFEILTGHLIHSSQDTMPGFTFKSAEMYYMPLDRLCKPSALTSIHASITNFLQETFVKDPIRRKCTTSATGSPVRFISTTSSRHASPVIHDPGSPICSSFQAPSPISSDATVYSPNSIDTSFPRSPVFSCFAPSFSSTAASTPNLSTEDPAPNYSPPPPSPLSASFHSSPSISADAIQLCSRFSTWSSDLDELEPPTPSYAFVSRVTSLTSIGKRSIEVDRS